MATSKRGTKVKPIPVSGKGNIINKVDGAPNVHCTKITEELRVPMRKVTDKMLGRSDRVRMCEAFHLPETAANYTDLAYIRNFLKKI
jgi:hypothetical protein